MQVRLLRDRVTRLVPIGGAARGVIAIITGTAAGQLLTLLALPILSRIYSPEQFGMLAYAASAAAIILPLATMRLEGALILPRSDVQIPALVQAACLSLLSGAAILAGILWFTELTATFGDSASAFLVWAIPALLVCNGLVAILSQLAVRDQSYGKIGTRNTFQSVGITVSQFVLSPVRSTSFNGLVVGTIAGSALGAWVLRSFGVGFFRVTSLKSTWSAVKTFWRFPLVFGPMASFTLLAQQGPIFFATYAFGVHAGGQLAMADRIVAVPLALIGLAVGAVLDGEISNLLRARRHGVFRLYVRISAALGLVGGGIAAVLWLFGGVLLTQVFGSEWAQAGAIAEVMALVTFTRMVTNPTRRVLQLMEHARAAFALELARVALFVAAVWLALSSHDDDVVSALVLVFAALALADVATWVFGLRVARTADRLASETAREACA